MAALNIAFEAPDNSRGACPSQASIIDLVHLARQTMGDKALELDVLQMFARQARSALQELASDNTDTVIASAHRLRGTAASVGASRVLAAITAYEADIGDAGKRAAVGAAVIEAENFILKLCR